MIYKAPNNSLHVIDLEYAHLLPAGSVAITEEEAAVIRAAAAVPAIPSVVTMRQARRALLAADLLDTVNTTIAAMTGVEGEAARIDWEFAASVERDNPLFVVLASTLGLTDEQLDDLFVAAAAII